jgi:hypothetical protein
MNRSGAIMVMSAFAAIWWMIGAAQSGRGSLIMYSIGIGISALLVALDRWHGGRSAAREERKRRGRIVGMASAVEGIMIFAAATVLAKLGRRDLIAPAVAIIVGLHFLPLARWFPAPIYYLTAALLIAVGMTGATIQDVAARVLTICFGAAAALWLSCGVVLLRAHAGRTESVSKQA